MIIIVVHIIVVIIIEIITVLIICTITILKPNRNFDLDKRLGLR